MDKEEGAHRCSGIRCSHEMDIAPFATTRTNLEGITLSAITRTDKDEYSLVSHVESKITELRS